MIKRVVCAIWFAIQVGTFFAADLYEHRRLFLEFKKASGLPSEILDHIAHFLTFDDREMDDEFVARTSALKNIKKEHKEKVTDLSIPGHIVFNQNEALLSYGVHGNNIYRFREVTSFGAHGDSRDTKTDCLVSIALEPEVSFIKGMSEWKTFFGFSPNVCCFALSHDETVCAQVISHGNSSDTHSSKEYVLQYRNINNKEKSEIVVAKNYNTIQAIAFNKQCTKIIMFAKHNKLPENPPKYINESFYHIFPMVFESEYGTITKKTLVGYFKQLVAKYPNN